MSIEKENLGCDVRGFCFSGRLCVPLMKKLLIVEKDKQNWGYDSCYNLAKQCKTRSEMKKKSGRAYTIARLNNWFDDYTWMDKPHRNKQGTWTPERAIEESKKYKTVAELTRENQYLHTYLKKHDLLSLCTWLEGKFVYTKENCREIALQYTTVKDFNKGRPRAYQYAKANNLLETFDWLEPTIGIKENPYWTRERIAEEVKKYNYRHDFGKHCPGAYAAIQRNGWYDLLDCYPTFPDGNVYSGYVYDFPEYNATYVGITKRVNGKTGENERDDEHHGKGKYCDKPEKSPVYRFAKEHNITEYSTTYVVTGLTAEEAQQFEETEIQKYIDMGRTLLNKAKSGSLGQNGVKWKKDVVFKLAKKYVLPGDFFRECPGAYSAAHENGWMKEFYWMEHNRSSKWLIYENCYNEAKKYNSRVEFYRNSGTAYDIAREKKWLDTFTWFEKPKKESKYNYDVCKKLCSECTSRLDMQEKRGEYNGCLQWLRKSHTDWLDEFLPSPKPWCKKPRL